MMNKHLSLKIVRRHEMKLVFRFSLSDRFQLLKQQPERWCQSSLYLYNGHILRPLWSFWAAVDVARSTSSFRKWKSFSDSMHCFLSNNAVNQSSTLSVHSFTWWRQNNCFTHMWATDMTVLGFDWVIRQVWVSRDFRNISSARADLCSSGFHSWSWKRLVWVLKFENERCRMVQWDKVRMLNWLFCGKTTLSILMHEWKEN